MARFVPSSIDLSRFAVPRAVFLIASLSGTLTAVAAAQESPDLERAKRAFAEAERLSGSVGDGLWGEPLYGPMIFVDRTSRRAVANVADSLGVLEEIDGVYAGTLPDEVPIANTGVDWAGRRWTMVLWPLPYGQYERARLMAHETFHRIQDRIGLPGADPANEHLDQADARLWLRLEWRALREALLAEADARAAAVEDAVAFRVRRHGLHPDGAGEEIALELNEGLAEYTGFRASGLPGWAQRARAAFQLDDHDARARAESVVRSFAYASGPAYGLLLDDADTGWRSGLGPAADLGALLARAHGVTPPTDPREIEARAEAYGLASLRDEEERRAADRLARQAEYRRRFVEGPVLVLPATAEIRYGFDPDRIEGFDEGGTVYATMNARDAWGTLGVSEGGAWMIREDGRVARLVVPAPEDPDARPLEGDGWTLDLAEEWTLQPGERPGSWTLTPNDR